MGMLVEVPLWMSVRRRAKNLLVGRGRKREISAQEVGRPMLEVQTLWDHPPRWGSGAGREPWRRKRWRCRRSWS